MGNLRNQADPLVNPYNNRRMRREHVNWLASQGLSHAITLNINRNVTAANAKKMFKLFCRKMDQYRFERSNVRNIPSQHRFSAVATIEHRNSNIHLHVAAKLSGWLTEQVSNTDVHEFHRIWGQCTRGGGTLHFEPALDVKGWLFYISKEFNCRQFEWMFSADFHPH